MKISQREVLSQVENPFKVKADREGTREREEDAVERDIQYSNEDQTKSLA